MIPGGCSHRVPSCSHSTGTANPMSDLYLGPLFPLFPLLRVPPLDSFLKFLCGPNSLKLRECNSYRGCAEMREQWEQPPQLLREQLVTHSQSVGTCGNTVGAILENRSPSHCRV
jgi:hypothetical protein